MALSRESVLLRLVKRGYKEIGSGLFSKVFAKKGMDTVIKVSSSEDWFHYAYWAHLSGHAGGFAPKVFELHRHDWGFVARVERLDTTWNKALTNKKLPWIKDWSYYEAHGYFNNKEISSPGSLSMAKYATQLENLYPGLTSFARAACRAGFGSDWHGGNWMFNKGLNRLVLVDPQGEGPDETRMEGNRFSYRSFYRLGNED